MPAETQPSFGPTHIVPPTSQHTNTAIVLHGRGSNGEEFATEFFSTPDNFLCSKLPGWRWVFPSSAELWSTAFQEEIPAWFEAHSLTDTKARQELQIQGIRDAVNNISKLIQDELKLLPESVGEKGLVLGGISQGGAVALWTLLCRNKELGAVFVASTWLPFAENIERLFAKDDHAQAVSEDGTYDDFVESMMGDARRDHKSAGNQTPLFFGHGIDDAYVDIELGRQASRTMAKVGIPSEWKEYSGADKEGHWFKEPEEIDDICEFLTRIIHPSSTKPPIKDAV
ncbi:Phospholipase/carboxylesterase [Piedraia hortae CBS 480.64]|uniref:Phospholipase/carboxylesterase n=1 Tax=Piedraia hortae CBS 480.64 TaxID=1314780 RepID=A0A6A7C5J7_9PEZI|nr:Phospholipase/carboxylesterase [Piedraia hortae CBS 480.64]